MNPEKNQFIVIQSCPGKQDDDGDVESVISTPGIVKNSAISSPTAISHTGHFSVNTTSQLILDGESSEYLRHFMAYRNIGTKKLVWIGAIPGDEELSLICKNPHFLKSEAISNTISVRDENIHPFQSDQFQGCLINVDNDLAVIIVALPEPFISPTGDKINHIGIVASQEDIHEYKSQISFKISAKDYFINLLQIGQAFSPFTQEIHWDEISSKGTKLIGSDNEISKGLLAAVLLLLPELYKLDLHSFITTSGLDAVSLPAPELKEDPGLQKWLRVTTKTRNNIRNYASDFHGFLLKRHIAYLYIPSMDAHDPDSINKKVTLGREALTAAHLDNANGIIVDLRFNNGGSLVPMLLTLGGVLPQGKLFSIGKSNAVHLSEDGNTLYINSPENIYGHYAGKIPNRCIDKPVAILTNSMTSSSAAFTRLALRDTVKSARVFGTKTSPTTSVNSTFHLLDGNTFNLMVDRAYNHKNEMVPLELPVDSEMEDNLEMMFDPDRDPTLIAAEEWLESLPTFGAFK